MREIRCFVAVPLAGDVLDALGAIQRKLAAHAKAQGARLEAIPRHYLHLTLDDLGRCPPDADEAVALAVERLRGEHDPFTVGFAGLDAFPDGAGPRLIYARLRDDKGRLGALREALHAALIRYGFDVDPRPFHPHVALARVDEAFGALPSARHPIPDLRVRQISLFRQTPPDQAGPRFRPAWTQTLVRFPTTRTRYPDDQALNAEIQRQLDARLAHHAAPAPRGRRRRTVNEVQEA